MTSPAPPVPNGRPWTSIIAGGVVEKWGTSIILAGAVAGFLYVQHIRDLTQLSNQAAERKQHADNIASQRQIHTEQVDRLITLIANKMIEALDRNEKATQRVVEELRKLEPTIIRTAQNAGAAHKIATQILQKQESIVPFLLNQQRVLLEVLGKRGELSEESPHGDLPETVPPGRVRPPLAGARPL